MQIEEDTKSEIISILHKALKKSAEELLDAKEGIKIRKDDASAILLIGEKQTIIIQWDFDDPAQRKLDK